MRRPWFARLATCLGVAALPLIGAVAPAEAQSPHSATREACTRGDLEACVRVEVTATDNALVFAVSHLGVFGPLTLASQPSIVWNLVFATGQAAYEDPAQSQELAAAVSATGAAVLNDASPWSFIDVGDQWALTFPTWLDDAFTTKGIGSSAAAAGDATDEFGNPWRQIGTTGPDGALLFSVLLPTAFAFSFEDFAIIGLEATGFEGDRVGMSGTCGPDQPCGAVPNATVPEPSSAALMFVALGLVGVLARRHSSRRQESA